MVNFIIVAIIVLIIALALFYIIKAKKSGKTCIGCPESGGCCNCPHSSVNKK
jgi:hypothetical protein